MTLVVLEGYDEVGKSTVIKQLWDKYQDRILPRVYPTPRIRAILNTIYQFRMKDIDSLFRYHYMFLEDFMINNDRIQEEVNIPDHLVLCDRYFYSSAVYFLKDLAYYAVEKGLDRHEKVVTNLQIELIKTLGTFYTDLVQPDLILYMVAKDFNNDKWAVIADQYYKGSFACYPAKREVLEITALHPRTFETVEAVLKDYGYIK